MTIQKIPGSGLMIPESPARFTSNYYMNYGATGVMDAENEKVGFVGRLFTKDGAEKTLTTVSWKFGAVTKTNGSTLRVSLQGVSATTGDPDGTVGGVGNDQYATIANANANFVTDGWITATLTGSRTVNNGDLFAVVWDFNGGFQAGDSVVIGTVVASHAGNIYGQCYARLYEAAWGLLATQTPNLVFGFSDGSFGTFDGAGIFSALDELSYANNSTPDEYAIKFQVPFPITIDAIWALCEPDGDTTLLLTYGGSTASIAIDKDQRYGAAQHVYVYPLPAHIALSKDTDYYVSIRPDSTTTIKAGYADVANADYWQAYSGGVNFLLASRTDGGAWSTTATRRVFAGVRAIGFDDAVADFPDVGNVTEDDTVGGVQGTYHEATTAEVQDGVMFGASSALEGTYVGGGGGRPEIRGGNL